mgnify:CR=1 FL=1
MAKVRSLLDSRLPGRSVVAYGRKGCAHRLRTAHKGQIGL